MPSLVGGLLAGITIILGFGITQLEFATGQDSYLNKSDEVYQDSVAYQDLFGGQAMLTPRHDGRRPHVDELFTEENLAIWEEVDTELHRRATASAGRARVHQPLDWRSSSTTTATSSGNPTRRHRRQRAPRRRRHATRTGPRPAGVVGHETSGSPRSRRRTHPRQPGWVEFLLHDNQGKIRKSLLPVLPRRHPRPDGHPAGGQPVDRGRGRRRRTSSRTTGELEFEDAGDAHHRRAVLLKDINDYLTGGMLILGADRRRDHGRDPAGASSTSAGGCSLWASS